ncbi:anti-sigma factor family protein [Actinomadura alba]|uniref:Zf-HC2 domain-containing protein n=1 Tax=Actinomadura alba TaxID=406431 RepID=A0ABR7LW92_9ACTN|nr:zf-HC2 domain-containing protein [Actinomadura alba]MBC6469117.1 zf-HC2 domain-containing protein [Actinomadura alba]
MSDGIRHTDVGAYALGVLDDTERELFELHLIGCDACTAEFADLSGMRRLFSGVAPAEVGRDAHPLELFDLLSRRATTARRRRRGTAVLSAAAGIALLAGGVAAGAAIAGQDGSGQRPAHDHGALAQDLLGTGDRRSATDPTTRVVGTVAMEAKGWGTQVALGLSRVRGPLVCRLVAVTRSGGRHVVTEWAVPKAGYGFPGSPGDLAVHGGTASGPSDIMRFEVQAEDGRTLLTIPV